MAEIKLNINGRQYDMACDDGQEARVEALAAYIDRKMKHISSSGAAHSENHLFMLVSLLLADELFDLKEGIAPQNTNSETLSAEDEERLKSVITHLKQRLDSLDEKVRGMAA